MLLIAICVVWYNPEFFPPEQTQREFRELTLTLPLDVSEDDQAKVLLLGEIDVKLLQPMTMHRLQELRQQIQVQSASAEDVPESEEKDEVEEDVVDFKEFEEDMHAKPASFRQAVKVGDQVAILVDKDEEGVPFLIGDAIKIVTGTEPLEIHWFSPAVKRSGGGKVDRRLYARWCEAVCRMPTA